MTDRKGLCFILRGIIEFEEYLPNELCDQTDSCFSPHFSPTTSVTLDKWVYKLFEPQAELNGNLQAEGNLKLHNLFSSGLHPVSGLDVFQALFPFTEPTSWHLMLEHFWGREPTFDPQGCLPYVDLKTCLCVTSFAHTDLSSSPVLQICKDSLILSLL